MDINSSESSVHADDTREAFVVHSQTKVATFGTIGNVLVSVVCEPPSAHDLHPRAALAARMDATGEDWFLCSHYIPRELSAATFSETRRQIGAAKHIRAMAICYPHRGLLANASINSFNVVSLLLAPSVPRRVFSDIRATATWLGESYSTVSVDVSTLCFTLDALTRKGPEMS